MSYSGGIVSKPVTMTDISQAVGTASKNLGYLIKTAGDNNRINRFAKYKPLCINQTALDRSTNWWKGEDGMCGLIIPYGLGTGHLRTCAKQWEYKYPGRYGAQSYPYRMHDFDGYSVNAQSVFNMELYINDTRIANTPNDTPTEIVVSESTTSVTFKIRVNGSTSDSRALNFSDLQFNDSGTWVSFANMLVYVVIFRMDNIDGVISIPENESSRPTLGSIVGSDFSVTKSLSQEAFLTNTPLYANIIIYRPAAAGGWLFPMHNAVRLPFQITKVTNWFDATAEVQYSQSSSGIIASIRLQMTNGYAVTKAVTMEVELDRNTLNPDILLTKSYSIPRASSTSDSFTASYPGQNRSGQPWTLVVRCIVDGRTYQAAFVEIPPIN